MIDLHIHILPGLDDGARDLDEALAMAQACVDDGVTTVVGTPHMGRAGTHDPTVAEVLSATHVFCRDLHRAGIPLTGLPGADVVLFDGTDPAAIVRRIRTRTVL